MGRPGVSFCSPIHPLDAIRDDWIYLPSSNIARPPLARSLFLACLIWSPARWVGGGAGDRLVSRWRAACFLLPVFVLLRLRGLAIGFLFNIIFSYLTFQMLNSKRFRYDGKNELRKTAQGTENMNTMNKTV